MQRRNFFKTLLAGVAASSAIAATSRASEPAKQKVVYHLADAEKVKFVLGNIQNHIKGVGGPDHVEIALVVHGPALAAFQDISAEAAVKDTVARLNATKRVSLAACGNTLRHDKLELSDLLPGFVRVDEGGVVRIAQLQAQGYVYLRP